jgi:hypothetical protein
VQGSVQSTLPADPMQTLPAGQDPGHDPAMGGGAGRATQVVVAASVGNTQVQTPPAAQTAPGTHAWQVPLQMALAQSLRLRHPLPTAQGGQSGPPQSTSVSRPFLTPSLHVAGTGVRGVTLRVQVPLWQVPSEQSVPFAFCLHWIRVLPDLDLCFFVF